MARPIGGTSGTIDSRPFGRPGRNNPAQASRAASSMHVSQPIGGAADDYDRRHSPENYYRHDPLLRFPQWNNGSHCHLFPP
jgi:hypothetical protein